MVSSSVTATICANGLEYRLGLKQIPAGPSRVRAAAKAPPKRMGEVWGTVTIVAESPVTTGFVGFVGYTFGYGGYGGYARNSVYGPQTGLRFNT